MNIGFRHKFEPHGLPDAGGARVITALRIEAFALLAVGLFAGAVVVLRIDGEAVLARAAEIGDVEAERGVAAAVRAGRFAVHKHVRLIIDGAEVQQHAAG